MLHLRKLNGGISDIPDISDISGNLDFSVISDHISNNIPSQINILNMVIPILMYFVKIFVLPKIGTLHAT